VPSKIRSRTPQIHFKEFFDRLKKESANLKNFKLKNEREKEFDIFKLENDFLNCGESDH